MRKGTAAPAASDPQTAWDTAVAEVKSLLAANSNIVNGVIPSGDADAGSTALHLAAAGHNLPTIFEALLTAGAVHTLTDGNSKTALISLLSVRMLIGMILLLRFRLYIVRS